MGGPELTPQKPYFPVVKTYLLRNHLNMLIQLVLCIHRFCIHRVNQPETENMQEKAALLLMCAM